MSGVTGRRASSQTIGTDQLGNATADVVANDCTALPINLGQHTLPAITFPPALRRLPLGAHRTSSSRRVRTTTADMPIDADLFPMCAHH